MHRPDEYSAVLSSRPVFRSDCFALHCSLTSKVVGSGNDTPESVLPRLGLVIPKRLAKTASLRNAIKRQVRERFRLQAADLPALDFVVRLNKPLKGIKATTVAQRLIWRTEVDALFKRVVERVC